MLPSNLFLSGAVNKRTIQLPDGSQHELYFKEASSGVFRAYWAAAGRDADEQELAAARLIVASLVNPDGSAAITVERAAQLRPAVVNQIIAHVLEVNGFVKPKAEPSQDAEAAEAEPGNV